MKKFTLTLAVMSALVAMIYAGPEAIHSSGKETVVQPMPPPCPTFNGFYLGITGGYKHADVDLDNDFEGDDLFVDTVPLDGQEVLSHLRADTDADGAELGGMIGFNWQTHSNWVFGAEAAGGYLWLRDSEVSERFIGPDSGDEYHTSVSFKTHYLFTFGPRIGYAFCRWMPYVTGGLAVGDLELDSNVKRHTGSPAFGGFNDGGSRSDTNIGWMVGGGMEYALTNHLRVRAQYQYIDLGDIGFDRDSTEVDFSTGHSELSLREHNASFSLIYGF